MVDYRVVVDDSFGTPFVDIVKIEEETEDPEDLESCAGDDAAAPPPVEQRVLDFDAFDVALANYYDEDEDVDFDSRHMVDYDVVFDDSAGMPFEEIVNIEEETEADPGDLQSWTGADALLVTDDVVQDQRHEREERDYDYTSWTAVPASPPAPFTMELVAAASALADVPCSWAGPDAEPAVDLAVMFPMMLALCQVM
ncbi:hypothetical protein C0992_012384, partial [Termitomyces sp. T32_za158]